MLNLSKKLLDDIIGAIRAKSDPAKIVLFGSVVRADFLRNSDIDIALFGVDAAQLYEIEDYLNDVVPSLKDIDVVSFETIVNAKLKKRIMEEGQVIYEREPE